MSSVYIIGGANIDIQGTPTTTLVMADSNPGEVRYSFGGVGRNIAENIALLKDSVYFVSAMGNDAYGKQMYEYCKAVGMDMRYTIQKEENTAQYLAIMDHTHDMVLAICDTHILRHLNKEHIDHVFSQMKEDDLLVFDTNLEEDIIHYIVENSPCKIFLDPISTKKASKIIPFLSKIHTLKPNLLEAQAISGVELKESEDFVKMLDFFLQAGVQEIVISMGKDGVIAANPQEKIWVTHPYVPMKNATGAGDSFFGAFVHGSLAKQSLGKKVCFAVASAMLNIQSDFTVSEHMSVASVEEVLSTIEMEIKKL